MSGISRTTLANLESGSSHEVGISKIIAMLAGLGLDLRSGEANAGRPTLEYLQREERG